VLLNPVPAIPESSAAVMLLAGLLLVAGCQRRIGPQAIGNLMFR